MRKSYLFVALDMKYELEALLDRRVDLVSRRAIAQRRVLPISSPTVGSAL
ncbi:MAG: hypothetical protein F6J93_10680 [Oscillatoria sp. SIO1A7]|nr:hypothetical protein [Oscillatoria sp. SIO1A7]